jgi:hypothetical protein
MIITQTVDIPADRRVIIEVPPEIPAGRAQVEMKVTPFHQNQKKAYSFDTKLEEVRQLIHREMAEKGTLGISYESGDGWTAHVMEKYGKS